MLHIKKDLDKTGIYSIVNLVNGKQYIGSTTKSFRQRWIRHKSDLRNNKHHSNYLQNSWNKYSEEMFQFIIIEYCKPEQCLIREQYYIDTLKVCDKEFGYNTCSTAGNKLGVKHAHTTKTKIGLANTGKKHSIQTKEKMRLLSIGRKHTDVTKAKIALANTDKRLSNQHKQNIGLANTGKKQSDEHKQKTRFIHTGKKYSNETREKIALAFRKTYIVTNLNNEEITVNNLKEFCLINNLAHSTMITLALNPKRKNRAGWKCRHF